MRGHCPFRQVGVARSDGLEDALVGLVGDQHLPRYLQRDVALVVQPINHGVMDPRKDRVARNLRQDKVKLDVGTLERRQAVDTRAVGGESRLQSREVLLGGVARRIAREPDLEERARVLEMLLTVRLLQ